MSKTINLFVSHKGEDESKIDAFKKLMERKGKVNPIRQIIRNT